MIKQYEIWIADLDSHDGTEPGKTDSVLVLQTDLLNKFDHPSTIICPITKQVTAESEILRVHIEQGIGGVEGDCDILIDQIRTIDNRRLLRKTGNLPVDLIQKVKKNILIVLDIST